MRSPRAIALSVVMLAAMTLTPLSASSAVATPATTPVVTDDYVPAAGPIFNDPYGKTERPRHIENQIETMIDHAPAGSTIRVATLGLNVPTATDALIAAYRRGVIVRVVLPDSQLLMDEVIRLRDEIGNDYLANGSYVTTCTAACYSTAPGAAMHAKIYMFSQTGAATNVLTLSSANLTDRAIDSNWNDAYRMVGNNVAYSTTRNYFDSLRFDTPKATLQTRYVGDRNRLYFYPDPLYNRKTDVFQTLLSQTSCPGATSTRSRNGYTQIRVATSLWSRTRINVARKLGKLVARGCRVRVLLQSDKTAPEVLEALEAGHVPTRYSDGPANGPVNNHSKYFAVSGVVDGNSAASTVVTGSLNLSDVGSARSDNVVLRVWDSAPTYEEYADSFAPIWAQSSNVTAKVIARRYAEASARR